MKYRVSPILVNTVRLTSSLYYGYLVEEHSTELVMVENFIRETLHGKRTAFLMKYRVYPILMKHCAIDLV
jgi:hypothetical protein